MIHPAGPRRRGVAILGSTGSIGVSALRVLDRQREQFDLVALVAGANRDLLEEQVTTWQPRFTGLACGNGDAPIATGPESLIRRRRIPMSTS